MCDFFLPLGAETDQSKISFDIWYIFLTNYICRTINDKNQWTEKEKNSLKTVVSGFTKNMVYYYTKTWKHYYYSLVYIIVELWGESAVTYIYGKKSFLLLLSGIKIDWNKLKIKIMLKEACQNLQCGRRVEATIDFSDRHLR